MIGVAPFAIPGRVALVTAGSRGIGRACARALAESGARVALCSRDAAHLAAAADAIERATSKRPVTVAGDLADPGFPARCCAEVQRSLGPVEILVANVGGPARGSFDALDDAGWGAALDSTLHPTVRLVRAVLPGMRRARHGRVIPILSTSLREPIDELTASNVLRPALAGLVADLARANGMHRITVNAVLPGYTRTERLAEVAGDPERLRALTDRIPAGRLGTPEEIAAAVVFLASDEASFVNGALLAVDGGMTARV